MARHVSKLVWLAILLVLGLNASAVAGEVAISPLRVELDSSARISVMQLTNTGPQAITMQAIPMAWQQDADGADRYDPTDALIAFPPMFSMAPGQTQVVRIASQMPPTAGLERAYRLFFTEIPELPADDVPVRLRMRLRISIPAFDTPRRDTAPELELVRAWREDNRLRLSIRNTGRAHLRASSLVVETGAGPVSATIGKYFLSGTTHEIGLELGAGTEITSVGIETDRLGRVSFEPRVVTEPTHDDLVISQHDADGRPQYSAAFN